MDIEDIYTPDNWIPVKALREAANPKFSVLFKGHRKTASSPPGTPCSKLCKSLGKFSSACTSVNLHSRYNTASIESMNHCIPNDCESRPKNKQFLILIKKLNEEIMILSSQLRQSNEVISYLTSKLSEVNKRHVIHLQAIQERHEQKMRRNKQDFEAFLKEINKTSKEPVQKFEEINKMLQNELEISNFEFHRQVNWLKQFCVTIVSEVKEKFDQDLAEIKKAYKEKLKTLGKNCPDELEEIEDEPSEEQSNKFYEVYSTM